MTEARPNIIFIITDQQRYDTIAALGYPHVDTPHLDRLVREGITFSQCHVTAASCAAARASLFKGYFPHTTGILKNADRWRRSWIELLTMPATTAPTSARCTRGPIRPNWLSRTFRRREQRPILGRPLFL